MTIDEIKKLNSEELHKLSLQKYTSGKRKGCYTWEAQMAYGERQRRAGSQATIGAGVRRPSKFSADIDYYGTIYI